MTRAYVCVVRELKRHLVGYAGVIAFRELLRIPGIPVEIRRGAVILAGLLAGPFVISAFAWWVLPANIRLGSSALAPRICPQPSTNGGLKP